MGQYKLPVLEKKPLEDAYDEMELLGFPLCNPFELLETTDLGNTVAAELLNNIGREVDLVGYLVTTKDTRTKNGELMHFGTFFDYLGDVFDTTHFPPVAKKYPIRGKGFYRLRGKVAEDFGYPMVEVDSAEKLPLKIIAETVKPAPGAEGM